MRAIRLPSLLERSNDLVRQQIDAGNAADDIHTDQLLLIASDNISRSIADLLIQPRIITPNGDGENDLMRISYTLFGLFDAQVEVALYDLAGTRTRRMHVAGQHAGVNPPTVWDGRDEAGRTVPPGLYVCRVETETSRGRDALVQAVAVVY